MNFRGRKAILTVLIDSWAWIEYFRGSGAGKKVATTIEGSSEIIVSAINLAEIYYTTLKRINKESAERQKEAMLHRCRVVNVDSKIAVRAAEIKVERKWGLADAIILATAEIWKAKIITGDPHFKGIASVEYIGA